MNRQPGRIVMQGMGGFLCPPGHPMHTQSVRTPRGDCIALDYALTADSLDAATVACVRTVLGTWERNKPPVDSPANREWILIVLGYFAGCYNFAAGEAGWDARLLTVDVNKAPMQSADYHAGVHLIRRYYPEYRPTAGDFAGAYWGAKPEPQGAQHGR